MLRGVQVGDLMRAITIIAIIIIVVLLLLVTLKVAIATITMLMLTRIHVRIIILNGLMPSFDAAACANWRLLPQL